MKILWGFTLFFVLVGVVIGIETWIYAADNFGRSMSAADRLIAHARIQTSMALAVVASVIPTCFTLCVAGIRQPSEKKAPAKRNPPSSRPQATRGKAKPVGHDEIARTLRSQQSPEKRKGSS